MTEEPIKGADRRLHARHKLEIGNIVGFSRDGLEYEGIIVDISMGGLRLRMTERAPSIDGHFTLMHKRHKKKTTLITSNLGFAEWGSFLHNKHLTAALIDRLTENSHVINMKNCDSLRDPLNE